MILLGLDRTLLASLSVLLRSQACFPSFLLPFLLSFLLDCREIEWISFHGLFPLSATSGQITTSCLFCPANVCYRVLHISNHVCITDLCLYFNFNSIR